MKQLPLTLSLPESFAAAGFLSSSCNEQAYEMLLNRTWQSHVLYLYGEKGSGKTHLAHIWAQENKAKIFSANNFLPETVKENCAVEDIEICKDESLLFHLFNHCKESGLKLLFTSSLAPSFLPFALPDLTSRLRACPTVAILPPDDELLAAVMRKQFADKQLVIDDEVINYLMPRIERSFASIEQIVELLDRSSLAEKHRITVPFARKFIYS